MGPAMKGGFIGLGAMGQHMARNLHRAGLLAGTWNRTTAKSAAFAAETGTVAFDSPSALAKACDAAFTCVSADSDLLSVVDALRPGLRPGSLVIDCSTVAADTAREAHARVLAQHTAKAAVLARAELPDALGGRQAWRGHADAACAGGVMCEGERQRHAQAGAPGRQRAESARRDGRKHPGGYCAGGRGLLVGLFASGRRGDTGAANAQETYGWRAYTKAMRTWGGHRAGNALRTPACEGSPGARRGGRKQWPSGIF